MLRWFDNIKYFRSQPDLEGFDELEIEHLVEQARGRREDALWILPFATIIGMWFVVMTPLLFLARTFAQPGWFAAPGSAPGNSPGSSTAAGAAASGSQAVSASQANLDQLGLVLALLLLSIAVSSLMIASVFMWIWQRRFLILRSIRHINNKAGCPYCGFNLRGLPVTENRLVRCPECGESLILADLGLTKHDIMIDDGRVPDAVSPLVRGNIPEDRTIPLEGDKAPLRSLRGLVRRK